MAVRWSASWTAGRLGAWTVGQLEGWTLDGWTFGQLDGWTVGRSNRWTVEQLNGGLHSSLTAISYSRPKEMHYNFPISLVPHVGDSFACQWLFRETFGLLICLSTRCECDWQSADQAASSLVRPQVVCVACWVHRFASPAHQFLLPPRPSNPVCPPTWVGLVAKPCPPQHASKNSSPPQQTQRA